MPIEDKYNIKVLEKVLNMLKLFTPEKPQWTVNELCRELDMSRNNVYRILMTMKAQNFVEVSETRDLYKLGLPFVPLGSAVLSDLDLRSVSMPHMKQLRDTTKETVHLAICRDQSAFIIDVLDSPQRLQASRSPGVFFELHTAAIGKVFLAHLSDREFEDYIVTVLSSETPNSGISREELARTVENIRKENLAFDDMETSEGISGVAAPIYDFKNMVAASVGVLGPHDRIQQNMKVIAEEVKKTACVISRELGYFGKF